MRTGPNYQVPGYVNASGKLPKDFENMGLTNLVWVEFHSLGKCLILNMHE